MKKLSAALLGVVILSAAVSSAVTPAFALGGCGRTPIATGRAFASGAVKIKLVPSTHGPSSRSRCQWEMICIGEPLTFGAAQSTGGARWELRSGSAIHRMTAFRPQQPCGPVDSTSNSEPSHNRPNGCGGRNCDDGLGRAASEANASSACSSAAFPVRRAIPDVVQLEDLTQ